MRTQTARLINGTETFTDTAPNKTCRWQISPRKDASRRLSSGRCKRKQQGGTAPHLRDRPKPRTLTPPNAGEAVEQQEHTFLAGGNANGAATLGDSLAASYKTKRTGVTGFRSLTSGRSLQGGENLGLHDTLHTDAHKRQNLEAAEFALEEVLHQ